MSASPFQLNCALLAAALCSFGSNALLASDSYVPRVPVQKALQIVFDSEKFQCPSGNVIELKAVLTTGAEMNIGHRGTRRTIIVQDRMYWKIDMRVESTPNFIKYGFGAYVDAETGALVD